jgi:hypothetical protein
MVRAGIEEQYRKTGMEGFKGGNSKMGNQQIIIRQGFPKIPGVFAAPGPHGSWGRDDGKVRRSCGPQNCRRLWAKARGILGAKANKHPKGAGGFLRRFKSGTPSLGQKEQGRAQEVGGFPMDPRQQIDKKIAAPSGKALVDPRHRTQGPPPVKLLRGAAIPVQNDEGPPFTGQLFFGYKKISGDPRIFPDSPA